MRLGHSDYSRRAAKRLHLVQALVDLENFFFGVREHLLGVRLKVKNLSDGNLRAAVLVAKGFDCRSVFVAPALRVLLVRRCFLAANT